MSRAGVAVLSSLALIACGDTDRDPVASNAIMFVNASADAAESQLGGEFMRSYVEGNTSVPRDPTDADVPPLDPTAKPLDD